MIEQMNSNAAKAAQQFMKCHQKNQFSFADLDFVLDYAFSPDSQKAQVGTNIFFGQIIEPLSDTFLIQDRKQLEKVLVHLISRIRQLPQAIKLHEKLNQCGLRNETDLLNRMERISMEKKFDAASLGKIKKVFVPSRVTLGADVLLNSPVIEKMRTRFPEAEIVFLGSKKNGLLLQGNQTHIRIHPLQYNRRGDLLNRFLIWLDLIQTIDQETIGSGPDDDFIIVNTDSRLLQSGLLPFLPPEQEEKHYFFWKPSIHDATWKGTSQAEDLIQWLNTTFGNESQEETIFPRLHFLSEDIKFANNVIKLLNPGEKNFIVTMNLGVGGNKEKRVRFQSEIASRFEQGLIERLLADGVTIIIDKGFGKEEIEQADAILQTAHRMGLESAEISEAELELSGSNVTSKLKISAGTRLIAFQGTINKFAALIKMSDLYIGYDSLGQHLASALDISVITIFAGYLSELFPQRWKPMGRGKIHLLKARCGPYSFDRQDKLVDEVVSIYKSLRRKERTGESRVQ